MSVKSRPGGATNGVGRIRRAFRAHMRHELRTPINAIIGYSELLLEEAEECGYEAYVPDIEKILDAGKLLLTKVDGVLDSTRSVAVRDMDIDRFAAGVGHALRTPLNSIVGYAEMLIEDAVQEGLEGFAADLRKIHSGGQRMLQLISQVVDLAKVESGAADVTTNQLETNDIYELMKNIEEATGDLPTSLADEHASLLVVDDNPATRQMLSRRLERHHFDVTSAGSGMEALSLLQRDRFDLVLLDIVMTGMNGYQVLQKIKSDTQLRHIPVVMLSSLDNVDGVAACIEMGADDYLTKPYNPVLLNARISACLDRKRLHDREEAYREQLRMEREKSEGLLLNILPKPIAERLKRGEGVIVDEFPHVTILFADLVGFTPLTTVLAPEKLVALLNKVFSAFDGFVQARGLEKIKTSGDAYMAAGGLLLPVKDHMEAVTRLGLDMLDYMGQLQDVAGQPLQLRVGIEAGPVFAGVIGTSKLLYDLWGDTVNTASRMESHGVPGAVHVTDDLRSHLEDRFDFKSRGAIAIKGKGDMETWLLRP
jgi:adenylate cyclase